MGGLRCRAAAMRGKAMSFLKSLFGLGPAAAAVTGKEIEHKGFTIRATPFKDGGQFQTSGDHHARRSTAS